jgi:hypothetical protein
MTERRIISFDQFSHKGKIVKEDTLLPPEAGAGHDKEDHGDHEGKEKGHYMFFRNLLAIKHYVDEVLSMNPDQIENLLANGHDWASDHISSAKDDIQEVTDWARGEIEMGGNDQEDDDVPMDLEPDGEIEVDFDDEDMEDDDDMEDDMEGEEVEDDEEEEVEPEEAEPEDDDEEGEEVTINSDDEEEPEEDEEEEEIEIEEPGEERRNDTD